MRYLKTFESFNINETMDMMMMPVDPIAGAADMWSDILDYMKEKYKEFTDLVGDKWDEFTKLFDKVVDKIVEVIGSNSKKTIENIERIFSCPINHLDQEAAERVIKQKFSSMLKLNENHFEDEAGDDNITTSMPKESGLVQQVLAILQNIFAFNVYACFVPMMAFFAFVLGFGASYGGIFLGLITSFIAIFVVKAARKLVYKLEFGN
jgi:hypothetical protein